MSDDVQWRFMFGMGAVLPMVMIFLVMTVMPESPRWLVAKGQPDKAARVLERIYGDGKATSFFSQRAVSHAIKQSTAHARSHKPGFDVSPVILDMKEALEREEMVNRSMGWDMLFFPSPAFRRMLLVGLGVAIAQQAVGIDAIQTFLLFILEEAGLDRGPTQSWVLVGLGVIKLVFIVVGGILFDRRGRRPLLFVSLAGECV